MRADRLAVLHDVRDQRDLRILGLVDLGPDIDLRPAETARESDELTRRQVLLANHDHRVAVERVLDFREGRVADGPGQVETADFRADRAVARTKVEMKHGGFLWRQLIRISGYVTR